MLDSGVIRRAVTPRSSPCRPSRLGRRDTSTGHRLRVVERPYTPYLRWELQLLRLRAKTGPRCFLPSPTAARGSGSTAVPAPAGRTDHDRVGSRGGSDRILAVVRRG
ncbi:DUF6879 family protein [Streptosporangium sandarakinum]|uniref:DUF6879 family protein n=1 Tax=Streptosporangium sandarakinum TaxID=1260955 RepID=UPI003D89C4B8